MKMKIIQDRISTNPDRGTCFVHARGVFDNNGFGLITTQPLMLTGMDVFYGIYLIKSFDNGKNWSEIKSSSTLKRKPLGDGVEVAFADGTLTYHKKTGKILLTGAGTFYKDDDLYPNPSPGKVAYAVYDYETGDFKEFKVLELGDEDKYFLAMSGCCQICELENGDVLLPVYFKDKESSKDSWNTSYSVVVLRCSFDG